MSGLSQVPYDRLVEMEEFIRDRTHGDKACENAVKSLMGAAHAEAFRRGDGQLVFGLLVEAVDVVWNLKHVLVPMFAAPDPHHGRLWLHSDRFPDAAKAGPWTVDQWVPDQEELESVAADYLKHAWMSNGHIDWCFIDALTRREIVAYGAAVAVLSPKPWTSGWAIQNAFGVWLPWLLAVGVVAGSAAWLRAEFAAPETSPYRWWWAAGIAAYFAWWMINVVIRIPAGFRFRRAQRKERVEVLERRACMRRCYAELNGPVLDPTRVRDALLAAEHLGVRWSRATWPLLESAIAREPHRWLTTLH